MKDIKNSRFVRALCEVTSNMYRLGWDERNGGNVSMMLEDGEVEAYATETIRAIDLGFEAKSLAGKHFIVTGTGKYFKNVAADPENNLGVFRVSDDGKRAELKWGYADGGKFTSELPAHLMSHTVRLAADPSHRVIIHTHPTYTIVMNTVCPLDENDFTHKLWQSNTEAIVVFPDGVGVLPPMVCGTPDIGEATADKMKECRLVVWSNHGIYGAGRDMDETFGLIETVEKTAQLYVLALGHSPRVIPDEILLGLKERFSLTIKPGIIAE